METGIQYPSVQKLMAEVKSILGVGLEKGKSLAMQLFSPLRSAIPSALLPKDSNIVVFKKICNFVLLFLKVNFGLSLNMFV